MFKKVLNVIKKKVKLSNLILLVVLLMFNSYAWFIYNTKVNTSISAKIEAWDIAYISDGIRETQNIILYVEKIYPETISIFIMPPSFEELEKRIRNRNTDSEEVIKERLEIAKDEIKCKDKYDYVVINNTVDKAVEEIIQIIKFEKNE